MGQVAREALGREDFQERDYGAVFGTMAKWVVQMDDPARLPELISRAFHVATSGRPGPVVVAFVRLGGQTYLISGAPPGDTEPRGSASNAVLLAVTKPRQRPGAERGHPGRQFGGRDAAAPPVRGPSGY